MDKKDIYEHLAKIYLDASSGKKKKEPPSRIYKNLFIASIAVIVALSAFSLGSLTKRRPSAAHEIALVLLPEPAKINFHFDPAKKEIFTLHLNKLDLTRYRAAGFALKKANFFDTISVRVEFTNIFKEKSELYFKDIPHKWRDYSVKFSEFKNVSDWSEMASLSFTVEQWNAKEKKGVVYVDNVRLLK